MRLLKRLMAFSAPALAAKADADTLSREPLRRWTMILSVVRLAGLVD